MQKEAGTVIHASGLCACQMLEYMREITEMLANRDSGGITTQSDSITPAVF